MRTAARRPDLVEPVIWRTYSGRYTVSIKSFAGRHACGLHAASQYKEVTLLGDELASLGGLIAGFARVPFGQDAVLIRPVQADLTFLRADQLVPSVRDMMAWVR
jgi:hypothetical protein